MGALAILRFLFRKMWNTRWLTLSTLSGLIVAVAFTTSIPMYADGSLKRVVSTSLQEHNQGFPAGSLLIRYQAVGSDRPDLQSLTELDQFIQQELPERIGFPFHSFVRSLSLRGTTVSPVDPEKVDASRRRQMTLMTMSGLQDHTELLQGRLYSDRPAEDGAIEAIVMEESLFRNGFRVGDEFTYPVRGGGAPLTIRVVGAFEPLPGETAHDTYWYQGVEGLVNTFFVHEDVFEKVLLNERNLPLDLGNWYYHFDLREIQTSQLAPLARTLNRLDIELYQILRDTRVDVSFVKMLDEFRKQSVQLQSLLFMLAIPMIAMVFYYIVMNSRQALERQKNDIAVLRSRGASNRQIFSIYLLEGVFLGGISLVVGPFLGWFMAKSIGSSNGFLMFVNRKSIPVDVSPSIILYGLVAVLIALVATLVPATVYARSTIVGLKQQMARIDRKPLWMRWFLDIVLLLLSAYGWYLFYERQFITLQTGMTSDQLQVQPLLFFVPALTIFSIGLFFLRVFPWMLKLFSFIGKKMLPVPLYLTLTQMSRSSKAYYPLMLLLILTLGLGVYNSSAARTIDLNSTERTLYNYGTDVIIQAVWEGIADVMPVNPNPEGPPDPNEPPEPPQQGPEAPPPKIVYSEPPFEVFRELEGVEHAARVLRTQAHVSVSGRSAGRGMVMAIDNVDFAEVAWLDRRDLFPAHPYEYLNLLGYFEQAAIISTSFAEKYQLEPGDVITLNIEQQALEFVVVGILPYWPTQYPDEMPFFVVNLVYIYDQLPLIPYEVWLKMEDQAPLAPAIEQLQEAGIQIASVKDVRSELILQSRHPARGGVFGILSLGFLVSVFISLIGYVLFWFFNLSSRVVQFGVLRAMGLSRWQLTGMLFLEQAFTAGLSIVFGIVIGKWASYLYLPFLQTAEDARLQVPPFRIVFEARDTMQLYLVVLLMMAVGAMLLFLHIRRLKVHQAIKLGEER